MCVCICMYIYVHIYAYYSFIYLFKIYMNAYLLGVRAGRDYARRQPGFGCI